MGTSVLTLATAARWRFPSFSNRSGWRAKIQLFAAIVTFNTVLVGVVGALAIGYLNQTTRSVLDRSQARAGAASSRLQLVNTTPAMAAASCMNFLRVAIVSSLGEMRLRSLLATVGFGVGERNYCISR